MVEAKKRVIRQSEGLKSSLDHVLAELQRIELKLQYRVKALRNGNAQSNDDQFRGLYISEQEIDRILNDGGTLGRGSINSSIEGAPGELSETLSQMEKSLAVRRKEAIDRGLRLRLDILREQFGLSQFDIDTLLVCLLPEINLKYQRLLAYLQDDVTKKHPTVDLILHLLCDSPESRLQAREFFTLERPLMAYQLVHLYDEHLPVPSPLLAKYVRLDERIIGYLLDSDRLDDHLCGLASLMNPKGESKNEALPDEWKSKLPKLTKQFKDKGPIFYLYGSDEARKRVIVEAMCAGLNIPLLRVDISELQTAEVPLENLTSLIFREGSLQNSLIYFGGFNKLTNEDKELKLLLKRLTVELNKYPQWVVLSGEKVWQSGELSENKPFFCAEVSNTSYLERRKTWENYLQDDAGLAPDIDLTEIAGKFKFTSGQIANVIIMARNLAKWRDPDSGIVTNEDLYAACRKQSRVHLNSLARKINPMYRWEDMILPQDQMDQLKEISNYVAHYHKVYSDWGFGRKIATGKGLNVLFAGPSGTGKTMAAEVIANELGIDLYKIDLSGIVSKYIGETEKNLEQIFQDGETANAILFFDEADALFGKRSDVRDSHDRYANIEVAYLLQKMDDYDGIVILATNLRKNMDDAFARRMHYTLEFAIPEEADRYRIWQQIFPTEAPLSKNLDLKFMAKQFKITGGNIKNIALNAAFLATRNGGSIETEHLIQATKREYQKIGKLCTEADFGQYFELVKG